MQLVNVAAGALAALLVVAASPGLLRRLGRAAPWLVAGGALALATMAFLVSCALHAGGRCHRADAAAA